MDADPYWRPLSSGELIHIDVDLTAHCRLAFPNAPAHPLTLADLQPEKARSQTTMLRSTTGPLAAGRRGQPARAARQPVRVTAPPRPTGFAARAAAAYAPGAASPARVGLSMAVTSHHLQVPREGALQ